ncbi:MAG: hypothetical protein WA736_00925 [Candidatus Acidiferrum sp.]
MKSSVLILALLTAATVASAQQAATVQMQCHDLASSGNFMGPDEVIINGMACHPVKQASPKNANAAVNHAPTGTSTPVQASSADSSPATSQPTTTASSPLLPVTPESMKIRLGGRVYITPMDGFENYLAAALGKKKVPLVPVFDQSQADYVISGTSVDKKAGWAKIVFMGNVHSDNAASITMVDTRTGAIVYAYAVDKKSTMHGQQTTAEACAKHLKAHMEGHD